MQRPSNTVHNNVFDDTLFHSTYIFSEPERDFLLLLIYIFLRLNTTHINRNDDHDELHRQMKWVFYIWFLENDKRRRNRAKLRRTSGVCVSFFGDVESARRLERANKRRTYAQKTVQIKVSKNCLS